MVAATAPNTTVPPEGRGLAARPRGAGQRWTRRTWVHLALYLLACLPVLYVLSRAVAASRNIVYWDEFDTVLQLVLRLNEGVSVRGFLRELFAINNEHRMVTSRLLTATTYWLFGKIDFQALSALGNGSVIVLCGLLLREAGTAVRRVRLAVLLAFIVFHLAHYENILWPGSSIDHFVIVLLAGAAVIAVSRGSRAGLMAGMVFAALATFTLAHGVLTWPVGATMLWREKRRRELAVWSFVAALVVVGFLLGFSINAAHSLPAMSLGDLTEVVIYWLSLLGAVPTFRHATLAPWAGVMLLGLVGWAAWKGGVRRERVMFPLVWFALAAMALIAVGRAHNAGAIVHSRYLILSALAWALTAFMLLERYSHPRRPLVLHIAVLPLLVALNVGADSSFLDEVDSWIECRDRAAVRYIEEGMDGRDVFFLHPQPGRATALLKEAENRGVYRMPPVCETRSFPNAKPSSRIKYYVETMEVDRRAAALTGWAAIPGHETTRGSLHLVLRSEHKMHVYTTVAITRPDVAEAMKEPNWQRAGFRFARGRDRLPAGEYQIGLLIADRRRTEYIMTAHRINLDGDGQAHLANGN